MADISTTVSKQNFHAESWLRRSLFRVLTHLGFERRALETELAELPKKIRQDIGLSQERTWFSSNIE